MQNKLMLILGQQKKKTNRKQDVTESMVRRARFTRWPYHQMQSVSSGPLTLVASPSSLYIHISVIHNYRCEKLYAQHESSGNLFKMCIYTSYGWDDLDCTEDMQYIQYIYLYMDFQRTIDHVCIVKGPRKYNALFISYSYYHRIYGGTICQAFKV